MRRGRIDAILCGALWSKEAVAAAVGEVFEGGRAVLHIARILAGRWILEMCLLRWTENMCRFNRAAGSILDAPNLNLLSKECGSVKSATHTFRCHRIAHLHHGSAFLRLEEFHLRICCSKPLRCLEVYPHHVAIQAA